MNTNPFLKITDLYGAILEAIPDMLILCDGEGTIIDITHPNPELITADVEKLIGRRLSDCRAKDLMDTGLDAIETVIRTRQPLRFIFRHRKNGNGAIYYYEAYFLCLKTGHILVHIRTVEEESVTGIESDHLRRLFVDVLDNIAIPITVKSMDTERYVYWSKKAEVFGRTAGEMVGATEELFMPPEKARIVQELDRELAEGDQKQYQGIEKYVTNDGREHTFMISRSLFTFGSEKMMLGSALDISELKETQASLLQIKDELARNNMMLYSVLSLAEVVPWSCDLEKRIFYCDYNAYHPENAPEPDEHGCYVIPMDKYFASIHSDYRQEAIDMIEDLAADKRKEFREAYMVHWFNAREWEWVQVQSSVARRGADGRPVLLIGSAQRVTEQKTIELELRRAKQELDINNAILSTVLETAHVIPWSGDLKTGKFSCNFDAYHHESSDGADENGLYTIPFNEFFDRVDPDFHAYIVERFKNLIEGRTTGYHELYPVHWYNDREYEWVETKSSIFEYGENGDPLQIIGSARVVTAQKRMEESLREAKEEAERSNMLKSAFLANMSHEIRTPLNAIVGFSGLLAQAEEEAEKQEYLGIIQNSNTLLLQLVGDILDLSKIEAGTLEFNFADYDLNEMMTELEQTARMKTADPAVEIVCRDMIPGSLVHTDRGRLMQVLYNFINNAAKFTRKGHIHFGYRKHIDGRWYFYVEDTGCGIPADKTRSVFERFVKLNAKEKGTGLGLAISKSIIERLGGEIGVYSGEGHGSTFWFLLPAGSVTVSKPVPEPELKQVCPVGQVFDKPTILIAEDDPANYKLFEAMLRRDYTLLHAWNGREAVEIFRSQSPAMILMDIRMPEMDGYEATSAIRKISAKVPIVAVTAFVYPEDMVKIVSGGFNGCIPKPVNAEKLKEKIVELCH